MKTKPKKVSGYIFNGQFYEAQEDLINALMMERVLMWVQGKLPNISNFHQANVAEGIVENVTLFPEWLLEVRMQVVEQFVD